MGLLNPLRAVWIALLRVEDGHKHPLTNLRRPARKKLLEESLAMRGAVSAFTTLVKDKEKIGLRQAADRVARALKSRGYAGTSAKVIVHWRKHAMGGGLEPDAIFHKEVIASTPPNLTTNEVLNHGIKILKGICPPGDAETE
jgi:hypothetical protein